MSELGPNLFGELPEPGHVADCYLALPLPPAVAEAEGGQVLVLAPRCLLDPAVPQPDGSLVYELLTGHPARQLHELVFPADLTEELRGWPQQTWAAAGVDLEAACRALVDGWRHGAFKGLVIGQLTADETRSLALPAMSLVRERLRQRLHRQVSEAWLRWLHPAGRRDRGERFL